MCSSSKSWIHHDVRHEFFNLDNVLMYHDGRHTSFGCPSYVRAKWYSSFKILNDCRHSRTCLRHNSLLCQTWMSLTLLLFSSLSSLLYYWKLRRVDWCRGPFDVLRDQFLYTSAPLKREVFPFLLREDVHVHRHPLSLRSILQTVLDVLAYAINVLRRSVQYQFLLFHVFVISIILSQNDGENFVIICIDLHDFIKSVSYSEWLVRYCPLRVNRKTSRISPSIVRYTIDVRSRHRMMEEIVKKHRYTSFSLNIRSSVNRSICFMNPSLFRYVE